MSATKAAGTVVTVIANAPETYSFTLSAPGQAPVYSYQPPELVVPAGEVTFKVTNAEGIDTHNFGVCATPLTGAAVVNHRRGPALRLTEVGVGAKGAVTRRHTQPTNRAMMSSVPGAKSAYVPALAEDLANSSLAIAWTAGSAVLVVSCPLTGPCSGTPGVLTKSATNKAPARAFMGGYTGTLYAAWKGLKDTASFMRPPLTRLPSPPQGASPWR